MEKWELENGEAMIQRIKSWVSELSENMVPKRDQIKAWLQWVDFPMGRETP